jgi:hypothetical protein
MSEEVDPKAPEWYRLEVTKMRESRRTEQEAATAARAELTARLEAVTNEKAALATAAQKAQAERDRVARQYAMHKEGLTSDRFQRQLLRDYEDVRAESGDKAPDFAAWLAEQKKDPDVAAFFKAPAAAPAPVAAPVAAPAPVQAPAPSPAAPSVDRGVVVAPAVLAKDRDQEVVSLHRSGQLKGEALRKELVALGISEDQAKVMVK